MLGITTPIFAMDKFNARIMSNEKNYLSIRASKNDFGQTLFFVALLNNGTDVWGGSLLKMINYMVNSQFKVGEDTIQWIIKRNEKDVNPIVIDYRDREWFTSKTVQQFFQHHGLSYENIVITLEKKKVIVEERDEDIECIICLGLLKDPCSSFLMTSVSDAERITSTKYFLKNCDHEQLCHRGCLKKWLFESRGHNCPKCRAPSK